MPMRSDILVAMDTVAVFVGYVTQAVERSE
jgi:hypothetical protein